jgi:metallothionein
MNASETKCAHPSCGCHAVKDSEYCSTFCQGQGKTADILCGCGHMGCSGATHRGPEVTPVT